MAFPRHVPWQEAFDKPELYPHMGGVDVEKITGYGAEFGIEQINTMPGLIGPGGNGAKPSGMISVNGSLYLAVQNLLGKKSPPHRPNSQHGSDATILRSDDFGKTWMPDIQTGLIDMEAQYYDRRSWKWTNPPEERTGWKGWKPMFPGAKFGGPSFVQFGRDNSEQSTNMFMPFPATSGIMAATFAWDACTRTIPRYISLGMGSPQEDGVDWVNSLEESQPVLSMDGHLGLPEMVYLPGVGRYLLLTWGLHNDFQVDAGSELTILEAEHPWGPFRLVFMRRSGTASKYAPTARASR
jgi:hypothetical protein